jgi:hypothetical protein
MVSKWIPMFIATATGFVTLAGYLLPHAPLSRYRDQLIEWAVIVGAFAFILGLFNILRVHGERVIDARDGWADSLVLLLAALVSWIPTTLERPSGEVTQSLVEYVIGPLGASLGALVVFSLTLTAFRLLRHRPSPFSVLFIAVIAISLLGTTPPGGIEWLSGVREWLVSVPAMAGVRGLLLGVALGTVITGLRILFGSDRPYSEF